MCVDFTHDYVWSPNLGQPTQYFRTSLYECHAQATRNTSFKMKKKRRTLLNQSFDWIRRNPFANNLEVPNELLERWMFESDEEEEHPKGFHLSVFSFGYLQRDILTRQSPTTEPSSISITRLLSFFDLWQLKLGLVELHRNTDLRVDPMPLFTFPDGEEIRYWPSTTTRSLSFLADEAAHVMNSRIQSSCLLSVLFPTITLCCWSSLFLFGKIEMLWFLLARKNRCRLMHSTSSKRGPRRSRISGSNGSVMLAAQS